MSENSEWRGVKVDYCNRRSPSVSDQRRAEEELRLVQHRHFNVETQSSRRVGSGTGQVTHQTGAKKNTSTRRPFGTFRPVLFVSLTPFRAWCWMKCLCHFGHEVGSFESPPEPLNKQVSFWGDKSGALTPLVKVPKQRGVPRVPSPASRLHASSIVFSPARVRQIFKIAANSVALIKISSTLRLETNAWPPADRRIGVVLPRWRRSLARGGLTHAASRGPVGSTSLWVSGPFGCDSHAPPRTPRNSVELDPNSGLGWREDRGSQNVSCCTRAPHSGFWDVDCCSAIELRTASIWC